MNFSFIDDSRWKDLDEGTKQQMLAVAFEENVASDERWDSLSPETQQAMHNTYLDEAKEYESPEGYDVWGGVKEIGKLIYDLPVNVLGAYASMWEDDNPEAEYDWKDIYRKAQSDRNAERFSEPGGREYVIPGIQKKAFRGASASSGFSGVAMLTGLLGGFAALPVPLPGARVAGVLAGSGVAAYNMDKTMFTQQLINSYRQTIREDEGRDVTPEEVTVLVEKTKELRSKHALWEAIPESVGNLAQLSGIGSLFKAAIGRNLGAKVLKILAGMYGVEIGTETITQTGQYNVEIEAGLSAGQKRSFASMDDMYESFKEVAPQTFVLVSLMGGAGAVGAKTYQIIANPKNNSDASEVNPLVGKFNNGEISIEQVVEQINDSDVSVEAKTSATEILNKPIPSGSVENIFKATNIDEAIESFTKATVFKSPEAIESRLREIRGTLPVGLVETPEGEIVQKEFYEARKRMAGPRIPVSPTPIEPTADVAREPEGVEKPEVAAEKIKAKKWYHGTGTGKPEFGEAPVGNQLPFGAHFTTDKNIAQDFATGLTKGRAVEEKGVVLEATVLVDNPLDVRRGLYYEGTKEYEVLKEIAEKSKITDSPIIERYEGKNVIDPNSIFWKSGQQSKVEIIKPILKKHGYDKAILYSMKGTKDPLGVGAPVYTDAIAVLDERLVETAPAKPPTLKPHKAKPALPLTADIKAEGIGKVGRKAIKIPKKLYRGEFDREDGTFGFGTFNLGKGLYSTYTKEFAKKYGEVREVSPEEAFPKNPLVLNPSGDPKGAFIDWVLNKSGLKNVREFNRKYPDPGDFVREYGYDGVIIGDEIVKYATEQIKAEGIPEVKPKVEKEKVEVVPEKVEVETTPEGKEISVDITKKAAGELPKYAVKEIPKELQVLAEEAKEYKDAVDEQELSSKSKSGHPLDAIPKNTQTIKISTKMFEKEKVAFGKVSLNKIAFHDRPLTELDFKKLGKIQALYWDDKIKAGARPPILVGFKDSQLRVADGNNRLSAYLRNNVDDVPIILTKKAKKFLVKKERPLFAVKEVPEKDLVAYHNTTEAELLNALESGGLAMPSIAITRKDIPFEKYGAITLIGRKETIDPYGDRANRVFDSDIYSPRVPGKEWKVNQKQTDEIYNKFAPVMDELGAYKYNLEEAINKGKDRFIDYADSSNSLKVAFLREQNIPIQIPKKDVGLLFAFSDTTAVQEYLKSSDSLINIEFQSDEHKKLSEVVRRGITEYIKETKDIDTDVNKAAKLYEESFFSKEGLLHFDKIGQLEQDQKTLKDKSVEVDKYALEDRLKNKFTKKLSEQYLDWINEIADPMYGDPYIVLGRKKVPYTLDNIVESMRREGLKGKEKTMVFGPGQARAVAAKEIPSIMAMHKLKGRLVTEEKITEAKKVQEKIREKFTDELINHYRYKNWRGDVDVWNALDDAMKSTATFLSGKVQTIDRMQSVLKRYGFDNVSDSLARKAINFSEVLIDTPTQYFEAKPRRAVGFEEFEGIVIPTDSSVKLKNALKDIGLKVKTYKKHDTALRQKAVESFYKRPDVLFATKQQISESDITIKQVRDIFKPQHSGLTQDGNIWVKLKSGYGFQVKNVQSIAEDKIAFEVGRGRMRRDGEFIAGKFEKDTIEIVRGIGDVYTLFHESEHLAEQIGLITPLEINALKSRIRTLAKEGKFKTQNKDDIGGQEDRAVFIETELQNRAKYKGVIQRILSKIADFVDSLVNLFTTTARGVTRQFESGKIFEREVGAKDVSKINQFAQDVSFSLKKAVKNVKDNPNFRNWFGLTPNITGNNIVDDLLGETAIGTESEFVKSIVNSMKANVGNFTYLRQSRTIVDKIFNDLDIPRKRMVLATMVRMINAKPEIVDSIIDLIPIDVMNNLKGKKLSPQVFLHNKAMLQDLFSVDKDGSISLGSDITPSFVRAVAFAITESSPSDMGFWSNDLRSTMGAENYDSTFPTISRAKKLLSPFYPIVMDFKKDSAPRTLYDYHNSSFDKIELTIHEDNKEVKVKSKDVEKKIKKTKSKVVDEKGEPLVVYHGTGREFAAFDKKETIGGQFWFTDSRELVEKGEVGAQGTGRIIEAYLSLKNPAGWDIYDKLTLDEVIARGYDGFKLVDKGETTYVAFEPTQIKSIFNTGAFGITEPDIRYATKPTIDYKELKANKKLVQDLNNQLAEQLGGEWENAYRETMEVPESIRGLIEAFRATFKTRVIAISPTEKRFSRIAGQTFKGTLFIDTHAPKGFLQLAGHELLHKIKREQPDLYDSFTRATRNAYRNIEEFRQAFSETLLPGEANLAPSKLEEELIADFTGDALADQDFLKLFAREDPGTFKKFMRTVIKWLEDVRNKLSKEGFGSSRYFTDVDKLRTYLDLMLADFAERGNIDVIDDVAPPVFSRVKVDEYGVDYIKVLDRYEAKLKKAESELEKIKTSKEILKRRRGFIKAAGDYFNLTDRELRQVSGKDIRFMSNYEFKQYIDGIRIKAEKFEVKRQAMNELMTQIRDKELNIENLRKAMKLPTLKNMTVGQIQKLDEALRPFQKGDEFLSVRKLETVDRTELEGIKTWREARERLAKEISKQEGRKVSVEELQNIKVSEFDRFRYDTGLAERDPFYRMMVEKPAARMLTSEAKALEMEQEVFALARKIKGKGLWGRLVPQHKNVMRWMEAPSDQKAKIPLSTEEMALAKYMVEKNLVSMDYLIKVEAMNMGKSNYFTHIRRGILEAVKEDGIIKAVKELFVAYKLEEQGFNILDRSTGEVLAMDKFFKFAMHRTGKLKPTQNVVKAFLAYQKTFLKKQALDEVVPLIDIYAHALTPKGMTKKGLLLHGNLIKFVKEYLNTLKGRHITLIAKQNGKIDAALRTIKMFTSLRDLAFNIPVSVATEVGEQITTYQLLGKRNYFRGKLRQNTKQGKEIIEKYRNLIGKNPWKELVEPSKAVGDRLMEGIFVLFRDASERSNRTFVLGSLSKAEFKSGEITSERLASLRTELGRYRMVEGMKSVIGATPEGRSYTQYKRWAIPILRTTIKNLGNIGKKITFQKPDSKAFKKSALELYRLVEITAFVMLMFGMVRDEDDNSFMGKMINKAYREATTLIQALQPSMFLTAGRSASFVEKLGVSLTLVLQGEKYKTTDEYKGIKKLKRQFTPVAVSQFGRSDIEGREVGRFKKNLKKINAADKNYKELLKKDRTKALKYDAKTNKIRRFKASFRKANLEIEKLRKRQTTIEDSKVFSSNKKRDIIKRINTKIIKIAEKQNKIINRR